ncbi:MAG: hypothetical protein A3I44_04760 [Candidatus Sungbacteria bacterium RIFCSPLOWO2_02_FULL_51_17]|uniref:Transketolase-like pyrimidine-binding domain-containing protein n=1 Tax=Candidatus Sungbacteria bacterium RIFCSPHIGHO2_02_FULL_51_29 TaxID=1802273 RepID=A0A1G2KPB9_9BACT|nr:MAG: hypothetical protein A2676_01610 [Candidatus Sungbacteria bacterium RIFCSPHIGHO2_01_FULL_51_22]OHA01235.1 MAG: hypothetical protein A3C16_02800 [Candidatus Sungbacteria bacterium RIFCSPHIGHO2_02_FULL_51_29]OHA11344.1 MAG: hypothetical protein A3I44_04760 [Candidatus Sungbacteria bacterium RIFCSPLOWO2_02_FULL_51_17]
MSGQLARLTKKEKLELYRLMYAARMCDEKISWIMKEEGMGFIPTVALLSIGEEAVTAGASYALDPAVDWIFPGHRCKAALLRFGLTPLEDLANHGCKKESLMGGRDGNVHHASIDRHIGKFISHMGAGATAACGVVDGLRYLYELERKTDKLPVSMVFFGDGAAQQGIIHEAMNYAAVRNLPVIFVIDNNRVATVTHAEEQFAAKHLFLRAFGYNLQWEYVSNGNDVVSVYNAAKALVDRARTVAAFGPYDKGPADGELRAPAVLECETFRWCGHNETIKVPDVDLHEFAEWRAQDPIALYRDFLQRMPRVSSLEAIADREPRAMRNVRVSEVSVDELEAIEAGVAREVDEAYEAAKLMHDPDPAKDGLGAIWPVPTLIFKGERVVEPYNAGLRASFSKDALKNKVSLGQSLQRVIHETLKNNPRARAFGEDVAGRGRHKGGVYGMTLPALKDAAIPQEQIFDTPLSEWAITGSAIGQSLVGIIPIAEIQYFPFLSVAISQITDYAATHYYTTHVWTRMVLRLPYGAGTAGGHFHVSSLLEATLFHTPGLKMVDPATPADMAGLFRAAVNEKAPVMFKENLWALSRVFGDMAADECVVPIGKPALRKEGADLTIITWGAKTIFDAVLPAVSRLEADGHSIEIIELRSLQPYDLEFLVDSVRRTHRCLIVHEDVARGGVGQSVACEMQDVFGVGEGESAVNDVERDGAYFSTLAPITVYGAHFTPAPQHPAMERYFLPSADGVYRRAKKLLRYA